MSVLDYVVRARTAPRASNDNHRFDAFPIWRFVLAVGAVPTISALVILSILL